MAAHASRDLKARWAGPDGTVSDWGYAEAEAGWRQAYQSYEGRNPEWHFDDVLIDINNQQEGVAVFWVSFQVDGKMARDKLLFVETFLKENGKWKKIREYAENGFAAAKLLPVGEE